VDGLALIFSEGEVIVNDQFSFNTRAQRSDLAWWVAPEARPAATSVPTAWRRQLTEEFGAPIVEGDYSGGEDQQFTLSVMGSGQVGRAPGLTVSWTAEETGETGILNVGQGYEPGTPLAITDGMTLTLKPGVLNDGQVATFEVEARIPQNQWWRFDTAQDLPSKIRNVTNWTLPEAELPEEGGFMPALPEQLGPRVSTVPVQVGGVYSGDEAKVYTFTALADGAVGTTRDLRIQWEDDKGNVGELLVGEGYQPGTPLPFDAGLTVAFGAGRVFESDTFTTRTRTATIQPPQDALIHFGATELGGGLEISSPTNELEGVIDGVRLNLVSAANKPVTITIRGDTEQATESVKSFVDQFNELAALITELTKFDKETNIAGPLLGDRDVIEIRNRMSEMLVDPVAGLPPKFNMLLSLGIAFDDNGFLTVDQSTLTGKINEDFGSVADLFRNKGESNNPNVAFVGMTEETHINTEGYQVDVTRPATQGHYLSPALAEPVRLDASNNSFIVSVDGRQSENVELPVGQFTVTQYARVLQDAITNDKVIGQRGVRVIADGGQIKVLSGRFGAQSAIGFLPGSEARNLSPGLEGGSSEIGQDISGTIDGEVAEGNGQLLRAPDKGGKAVGLRLFVKLNESQLNPNGPEGLVVVTKGVASRLSSYLNQLVNPLTGQMRRITQNLRDRVNNLDQQLGRMEDRIDAKRKRLQEKFDRMESKMSTLRSQQSFMQGQLANMGGGNLLASLPR
jgi:flagellar hook-associated protein 2